MIKNEVLIRYNLWAYDAMLAQEKRGGKKRGDGVWKL